MPSVTAGRVISSGSEGVIIEFCTIDIRLRLPDPKIYVIFRRDCGFSSRYTNDCASGTAKIQFVCRSDTKTVIKHETRYGTHIRFHARLGRLEVVFGCSRCVLYIIMHQHIEKLQ